MFGIFEVLRIEFQMKIHSRKNLSIINLRHAYNLRIERKDERLTTIVVENFLTPN